MFSWTCGNPEEQNQGASGKVKKSKPFVFIGVQRDERPIRAVMASLLLFSITYGKLQVTGIYRASEEKANKSLLL